MCEMWCVCSCVCNVVYVLIFCNLLCSYLLKKRKGTITTVGSKKNPPQASEADSKISSKEATKSMSGPLSSSEIEAMKARLLNLPRTLFHYHPVRARKLPRAHPNTVYNHSTYKNIHR